MSERRKLTVDNLILGFRQAGNPLHPCLVLLHGWPQTSFAWQGVLDDLGVDQYVLAFDLPGVGDSFGMPRSAEKTVIADILITAAERAGGKDIIVAGYDVGGMIAFAAARDHGSRIKGAIVMNTVIPGLDPWQRVIADPRIFHFALHNVARLPETLISGRERAYFDFFYDMMAANPAHVSDEARAAYVNGYRRPEALQAGLDWYRAMVQDAEHNATRTSIPTPVRYVRGDAGPATTTLEDYAKGLKAAGVERLETGILPHSGEYAPEEAPLELIAMLKQFRRALEGRQ
jgi:pimeloyl-ACP methyl ester carboxylesterase